MHDTHPPAVNIYCLICVNNFCISCLVLCMRWKDGNSFCGRRQSPRIRVTKCRWYVFNINYRVRDILHRSWPREAPVFRVVWAILFARNGNVNMCITNIWMFVRTRFSYHNLCLCVFPSCPVLVLNHAIQQQHLYTLALYADCSLSLFHLMFVSPYVAPAQLKDVLAYRFYDWGYMSIALFDDSHWYLLFRSAVQKRAAVFWTIPSTFDYAVIHSAGVSPLTMVKHEDGLVRTWERIPFDAEWRPVSNSANLTTETIDEIVQDPQLVEQRVRSFALVALAIDYCFYHDIDNRFKRVLPLSFVAYKGRCYIRCTYCIRNDFEVSFAIHETCKWRKWDTNWDKTGGKKQWYESAYYGKKRTKPITALPFMTKERNNVSKNGL